MTFEKLIKQETKGRGVDLVLNSLAEEKLLASVRCLAKGGKFLEIGKFDLANNNKLNLLLLQKGCSFHGIMLDQLFVAQPSIKKKVGSMIEEGELQNLNDFEMSKLIFFKASRMVQSDL